MEPRFGRKLLVDKTPNRIFLKYLAEWRDEAKERGDKSAYTYGKAHKSLQKYPLPLQCGAEAKILENFGEKICKMLDDRLSKEAEENDMTASEFLENSRKVPSSWWKTVNQEAPVASKRPAKRKKVEKAEKAPVKKKSPKKKTILDMLGVPATEKLKSNSQDSGKCSTKNPDDIIDVDALDFETHSQADSANSQDSGKCSTKNPDDIIDVDALDFETHSQADSGYGCSNSQVSCDPDFVLYPGQFDVVLCVDNRETMGESRRKDIGVELSKQGVFYEQRTLHIGDFLWVAQEKPSFCVGRKPHELVLDYVIERKILSDLSTSIRDGRFREQKIRLKSSGIKNIIYLIENMKTIENQSLPEQTLRQAIYNTQVVDKILVKYTKNANSTVQYLDLMTKRLQKLYENCALEAAEISDLEDKNPTPGVHKLARFGVFNEMGSKKKKLTVKEMFLRQLMQVHGVSYDKASAITAVYSTPMALVQKYRSLGSVKEKEELLSKIKFGLTERNLGIAVSRVICKIYSE